MDTTPAIYTDKQRQLRGMISFHERAEKAYRASGNTTAADAAKAKAEELRDQLRAE